MQVYPGKITSYTHVFTYGWQVWRIWAVRGSEVSAASPVCSGLSQCDVMSALSHFSCQGWHWIHTLTFYCSCFSIMHNVAADTAEMNQCFQLFENNGLTENDSWSHLLKCGCLLFISFFIFIFEITFLWAGLFVGQMLNIEYFQNNTFSSGSCHLPFMSHVWTFIGSKHRNWP